MRLGWAVFITLALFTLSVRLSLATDSNVSVFIVLGSAAWAAMDSLTLGLTRYKSRLAWPPAFVFLGIVLAWIIGFPSYLMLRQRIKAGEVELKENAGNEDQGSPTSSSRP